MKWFIGNDGGSTFIGRSPARGPREKLKEKISESRLFFSWILHFSGKALIVLKFYLIINWHFLQGRTGTIFQGWLHGYEATKGP